MKRNQTWIRVMLGAGLIALPVVSMATTATTTKPTAPAAAPSTLDEFEDTVGIAPSPKKVEQKATRPATPTKKSETGVSKEFPDWSKRNAPDYKPTDEGLDNEF